MLRVLLSLSLQPASVLDKQETLSVISRLFVCLNECQAKDRENTHYRPHPDPTVNTLIATQETEREGELERKAGRQTDGAVGETEL